MNDDLLGIEFHDADAECVELRGDGSLVVRLSHVFGVVGEASGGLAGWSFSGELRIDGLFAVNIEAERDQLLFGADAASPATIWTATITGPGVTFDDVLPANVEVSDPTLTLTFAPMGAKMVARGRKLTLHVHERKSRLEDVTKWP